MPFKNNLISAIRSVGRSPLLTPILYRPGVRNMIQDWPGFRTMYGKGWEQLHPFDRAHGTETSGYVPTDQLPNSSFATEKRHVYAGSQPSIIRTALGSLPPLETFTFIDLGCGKGRPVLVASEFPFKELIGVELSEPLAETGRKNVALFRKRNPSASPMRVETGDASSFPYPPGNLVIFLYDPFGEEVVRRVITAIEAALDAESRSLFVVYYNPMCSICMDESPKLKRYFARAIPYADEERGFGPDTSDSVVIWQGGSSIPALPGADSPIRLSASGSRSEVTT